MVEVREAPYSGICNPGTITDSIFGLYVPLCFKASASIWEMGEGILSRGTDSFIAVTVAGCSRVSQTGDIIYSRDMNILTIIADAKICNGNQRF